jgi:hypothetical protein
VGGVYAVHVHVHERSFEGVSICRQKICSFCGSGGGEAWKEIRVCSAESFFVANSVLYMDMDMSV